MKAFYIIAIVVLLGSCSMKNFLSISKKIDKNCTIKKNNWKGDSFHEIRRRLFKEGKLNFINPVNDTLFFLESYELESGVYFGRIWNKKGVASYTYKMGVFDFEMQPLFTDYTIRLIEDWNVSKIRNEESLNANSIPEKYINATRVIIKDKEDWVECLAFKEFFKPERDR